MNAVYSCRVAYVSSAVGLSEPGLVHEASGRLQQSAFFFQLTLVLFPAGSALPDVPLETADEQLNDSNLPGIQLGKRFIQFRNLLAAKLDLRGQSGQFLSVLLSESRLFRFEKFFQGLVWLEELICHSYRVAACAVATS